jgi:hypothetical protein
MNMKKIILLSVLAALIMLQTSCKGSESPSIPPSIFDTWSIASLTVDGHTITNVVMTLNSNGTFSETFDVGNSVSGTVTPATCPLQTVITVTVTAGSGPGIPPLPFTAWVKFDNLTSTSVDLYGDNAGDGFEGPFQLTRM